jgi:hypothetical protein
MFIYRSLQNTPNGFVVSQGPVSVDADAAPILIAADSAAPDIGRAEKAECSNIVEPYLAGTIFVKLPSLRYEQCWLQAAGVFLRVLSDGSLAVASRNYPIEMPFLAFDFASRYHSLRIQAKAS